ncbi:hypothetical protein NDN08_001055 [Rhodosorus marinus]|uniref:Peptidase M20 dimerisation domain-containing protein n=1 Tax=Rhodosorus marinus TaxID=101924 RepID=A0AAV8UTW7_9RHOD|nr:hypothetical protein NDN08_001055 [Rhodosorus marinus]
MKFSLHCTIGVLITGFVLAEYDESVSALQEYLRLRTDHPNPKYWEAARWLEKTCEGIGLTVKIAEYTMDEPVVICSIAGQDPSLQAVMVNSHMDVVSHVDTSRWKTDPYGAEIVDNKIIGRGAQDMKSIGMMYLFAIKALFKDGWKPERSIHVTFVPEEETNGSGMESFVNSEDFKPLNIGFSLDEGLPTEGNDMAVYYGERGTWKLHITVNSKTGHGATLPHQTAIMRLHDILGKILADRDRFGLASEKPTGAGLNGGEGRAFGVNIIYLKAGVESEKNAHGFTMNVIPSSARAGLDLRIPPGMKSDDVNQVIKDWVACDEHCEDTIWEVGLRIDAGPLSTVDEGKSPFYKTFRSALSRLNVETNEQIFPGGTDSRFLRYKGIEAIGFSPINASAVLLHEYNESIGVDIYQKGIEIYKALINDLTTLGKQAADLDEEEEKDL